MIYKEVFERSRFSVMREAVCAAKYDGKLLYKNHSFKELCRGYACDFVNIENEPEADNIGRDKLKLGRNFREFDLAKIDLFGEKLVICTDCKLHSDNFPLVQSEHLYTGLDTLSSRILIPVFGGRVIKLSARGKDKNDIADLMSDYEVGYFCIDTLVTSAVRSFKKKMSLHGYRIDTDILSAGNPVCNVNMFDFILVLEMLMLVMTDLSGERTASISVSQREDMSSVIIEVLRDNTFKSGRISPEKLFDNNAQAKKAVKSLVEFCSLYSWNLVARVDAKRLSVAFSFPICNHVKSKFRNETDKSCERAVEQVSAVLYEDFKLVLG